MKIPMLVRVATALVFFGVPWVFLQAGPEAEHWEAQWVSWAPNEEQKWPVLYSCRPFALEQRPESATIRITAVDYFKLYVNGGFVGEGPPRNAPKLLSYNSFDVSGPIAPGENIVAVEMISARPRFGYADPEVAADQRPAFAAQLEIEFPDGSSATLATNETWRIAPGPWHNMDAHSAGDDRVEVFEAKLEPRGWRHLGQVSSDWDRATVIADVSSDGHPYPGRRLQPSILPHYRRTEHPPTAIVRTGEVLQVMGDTRYSAAIQMATEIVRPLDRCAIENDRALLQGAADQGPATISNQFPQSDLRSFYTYWDRHDDAAAVRNATMIIDFGKLMNAYIQLDVEGNEDAVIDIAWGQTLIDGRVLPLLYTRQAPDQEGKPNAQLAARYYLAEGRQQWETFHWQNFRYLQLTFRRLDRPLKLHRIAAVRSFQPLDRRGTFRSSDSFLDNLFTANANTLEAASYDLFMDNAIREKQVWGGDISDGSVSTCLAVFGDAPILRHYMTVFCDAQLPSGALPQLGTHRREGPILAHQIRTAIWMAEYGLWCNDQAHYRSKVLPAVGRFLEFLVSIANDDGILVAKVLGRALGPPSPAPPGGGRNWVDHVYGLQPKDVSVPVNLFHVLLLGKAARVFDAYGDPGAATEYRSRAQTLRSHILANFWSESNGLYLDGTLRGAPSTTFSEHANYLALLEGLGGDGRADRVLAELNDPGQVGKIVQSGPPFMLWPPAALFSLGRPTAALDLLRNRYRRFFKSGVDTLWEEWSYLIGGNGWGSRYRSLAQNGAGSPAWLMATEVLGVTPVAPGFEEFAVQPKAGELASVEGVVPSPAGEIDVSWRMEGARQYSLEVGVPAGTRAHVHLPRARQLFLGGKPAESAANVLGTTVRDGRLVVTVPEGRHRFEGRGLE